MARNEFEDEVGDLLRRTYPVVHRIADAAFNRNMKRQVSKKPFDFFGCTPVGTIVAVEAKRVKQKSIPWSNISDHQWEALDDVDRNLGFSYLFVNFRVKEKGRPCGRAFAIPFFDLANMRERSKKKSFNASDIPPMCELKRITGGWEFHVGKILREFLSEKEV